MKYVKYVEDVLGLKNAGLKSGRDNILKYLAIKGNPQNRLKIFHVAGTNGKGSVTNMIYQTLYKEFGFKVGIFISPHLVKINERIEINGIQIGDRKLDNYFGKILEETREFNFSFFEICVLTAIMYFIDQKVDYAVFEVGLGGTYDGTNIFKNPLAIYITSISSDHTHILGKSLSSIQKNKMGIIKSGVPVYTPIGNKLMIEGTKKAGGILKTIKGKIPTNLNGSHQKRNAGLVYHSLIDFGFDSKKVLNGLQNIKIRGRVEFIEPNILLDGCHNIGGFRELKKFLKTLKYNHLITIFATTKEKNDFESFCNIIDGDIKILTKSSVYKAKDPDEFEDIISGNKIIIKNPKEALKYAKSIKKDGDLIVIYGSLFLVGDILRTLKNKK
ncbi:MAG: Mur ligase family protein [Candidatus Gracilibacteria bacterium]|nr:Mur ligase family protein [Candidatus Gracilibacteria bacterium]MDD3119908.1 Mur ligase family protein [Candidatus Gracilibacteria bacterium]MDD4530034.1 Mur ligase family protein [Candidatus Gracilibacteria bacterium]